MRHLRLVKDETSFDFFKHWKLWLGISGFLIVLAMVSFGVRGLNYGIDFRGGTTIRTESTQPVDVGAYRQAIDALGIGDSTISEVFDPSFGPEQNVAMVRIAPQGEAESVSQATIENIRTALAEVAPDIEFTSVSSVGPKVSGELIQSALFAVLGSLVAILFYIWLRFEWQFAVGAVVALVHDVALTIGIFSELQIRFDLLLRCLRFLGIELDRVEIACSFIVNTIRCDLTAELIQ